MKKFFTAIALLCFIIQGATQIKVYGTLGKTTNTTPVVKHTDASECLLIKPSPGSSASFGALVLDIGDHNGNNVGYQPYKLLTFDLNSNQQGTYSVNTVKDLSGNVITTNLGRFDNWHAFGANNKLYLGNYSGAIINGATSGIVEFDQDTYEAVKIPTPVDPSTGTAVGETYTLGTSIDNNLIYVGCFNSSRVWWYNPTTKIAESFPFELDPYQNYIKTIVGKGDWIYAMTKENYGLGVGIYAINIKTNKKYLLAHTNHPGVELGYVGNEVHIIASSIYKYIIYTDPLEIDANFIPPGQLTANGNYSPPYPPIDPLTGYATACTNCQSNSTAFTNVDFTQGSAAVYSFQIDGNQVDINKPIFHVNTSASTLLPDYSYDPFFNVPENEKPIAKWDDDKLIMDYEFPKVYTSSISVNTNDIRQFDIPISGLGYTGANTIFAKGPKYLPMVKINYTGSGYTHNYIGKLRSSTGDLAPLVNNYYALNNFDIDINTNIGDALFDGYPSGIIHAYKAGASLNIAGTGCPTGSEVACNTRVLSYSEKEITLPSGAIKMGPMVGKGYLVSKGFFESPCGNFGNCSDIPFQVYKTLDFGYSSRVVTGQPASIGIHEFFYHEKNGLIDGDDYRVVDRNDYPYFADYTFECSSNDGNYKGVNAKCNATYQSNGWGTAKTLLAMAHKTTYEHKFMLFDNATETVISIIDLPAGMPTKEIISNLQAIDGIYFCSIGYKLCAFRLNAANTAIESFSLSQQLPWTIYSIKAFKEQLTDQQTGHIKVFYSSTNSLAMPQVGSIEFHFLDCQNQGFHCNPVFNFENSSNIVYGCENNVLDYSQEPVVDFEVMWKPNTNWGDLLMAGGTKLYYLSNAVKNICEFIDRRPKIEGARSANPLTTINNILPAIDKVTIFPSPAKNQLTVSFANGEFKKQEFEILSMDGRMLKKGVFVNSSTTIDISKFSSGMYILKIGSKTTKFIKE